MNSKIQQLSSHLVAKDMDKVQDSITEIITRPVTDEEKGSAMVALTKINLGMKIERNAVEIERLKQAISAIKQINKSESKAVDGFKLKAVRASLG